MDIEKFKKHGYAYSDIKVEDKIIDKLVEIISKREKQKKGLSQKDKHYTKIAQPWLIDECMELALRDDFLEIPSLFFSGRPFYLGSGNLRRTKFTKQPAEGVALFHRDKNLGTLEKTSGNFLKIFIYLNEVTEKNGPFTYIEGSNDVYLDDLTMYRKTDRDVKKQYPGLERRIVGPKGQVFVGMTHGLHKGLKPIEGHRDMLTINYGVDKELVLKNNGHNFKVKRELIDSLSNYKKDICKNLIIQE
jgi:hypothetical protein